MFSLFFLEIDVSFQDVWSASAKYIIEAAKTTGKKKVNSILSSGMFTTMTPGKQMLIGQSQFTDYNHFPFLRTLF
jgi:hypothetical protein